MTLSPRESSRRILALVALCATLACAPRFVPQPAELVLINGRVYSLDWGEPDANGVAAPDAPFDADGWRPDATAVAIQRGLIIYVGDDQRALGFADDNTSIVDLDGATAIPGLVDSHTHVLNLGATLEQVDLVGAADEAAAVARVAARARRTAPGEWIVGYGWDDSAWADRYPDKTRLTEAVPDHPVLMRGLHGFAVWGNRAALRAAGLSAATPVPSGGRVGVANDGQLSGLFLDRATDLLTRAVPAPTVEQLEQRYLLGLDEMARSGFTTVHEAGVDSAALEALENLAAAGRLPLRVYAMLDARDPELLRRWMSWGPDIDGNDKLITRAIKAYYDGALGSRGARLLAPYSDLPGHYGVSGSEYGFDEELVAEMIAAGFQANIHAIGDGGNRDTLDFFARMSRRYPGSDALRHRIEHAQVVQPGDFWRYRTLGLTASVQPPHAVEDKAWARQRLGEQRLAGAYAWRSFRSIDVPLVFSSDLPGSDHDIFYGLQAAITRRDEHLQPSGGWFPRQRMSAEEALRGYTSWAARAAHTEAAAGRLDVGRWADITVMNIDPLAIGSSDPDGLARGRILMTIVGGRVVSDNR